LARDYRDICDDFFYWASAESKRIEVDFLLQRNGTFIAIEVKTGNTFRDDWCRGLRAIQPLKGLVRRLIVYPAGPNLVTEDNIEVLQFDRFRALTAQTNSGRSSALPPKEPKISYICDWGLVLRLRAAYTAAMKSWTGCQNVLLECVFTVLLFCGNSPAEEQFFAFDEIPDHLPDTARQAWRIEQCVEQALTANYNIAIQQWAVTNADADVMARRGDFEPSISGYAGRSHESGTNTDRDADSGQLELNTRFITGTEISLYSDYAKDSDDDSGTGRVGVEFSQPLLRNFGIRVTRALLTQARREAKISRHDFIRQMIDTVARVEENYWQLVLTRERLAVQEASLESARKLDLLTRQRAEARIMSESDTVEAQAAVYEREANVVSAGENVRRLEDIMKENLGLLEDPAYWTSPFIPATPPILLEEDADFLRALRISLENRPDYRAALLKLKNLDLSLYVAKNRLLPKLDLVATGERQDDADNPGRAFDAASSDEEIWSAFLRLELPLGNKDARAARDSARAAQQQQLLRIRQLEVRIIREVRRAVDALHTNRKLVEATQMAVEFEQKKLENEETKLELGKSTTDNVVRFIQSLNSARLRHVQSVIDYNIARVRLKQVQGTTLEQYGVVSDL
jgi:outer membrane protein TolC